MVQITGTAVERPLLGTLDDAVQHGLCGSLQGDRTGVLVAGHSGRDALERGGLFHDVVADAGLLRCASCHADCTVLGRDSAGEPAGGHRGGPAGQEAAQ